METLDVDVILIGSSLENEIAAGALSRVGKSCVVIDNRSDYGSTMMTIPLSTFFEMAKNAPNDQTKAVDTEMALDTEAEKQKDPNVIEIKTPSLIKNVVIEPEFIEKTKTMKATIDLVPTMLYYGGGAVRVLVQSGVSRYVDFCGVDKVSYWDGGWIEVWRRKEGKTLLHLFDVGVESDHCVDTWNYGSDDENGWWRIANRLFTLPYSRATLFSTKALTLIEKRTMMRFLTTVMNDVKEKKKIDEKQTFVEYMNLHGLNDKLKKYVLYGIVHGDELTSAVCGVCRLSAGVSSAPTPTHPHPTLITTRYGAGDCPQAFARLSAIYGGYTVMNANAKAIKRESNRYVVETAFGVFRSEAVIASASVLPMDGNEVSVGRSVGVSVGEWVSVWASPPVHVLARPPLTHLVGGDTHTRHTTLTALHGGAAAHFDVCGASSPKSLDPSWKNFYVTSEIPTMFDFDERIEEAKRVFTAICPKSEFLPYAPSGDELVFEKDANEDVEMKEQ